jgi:Flp pilus assembly protein TadD
MVSVVLMVTVALVVLILLVRRGWWRTRLVQLQPGGIPLTTLALQAFMQGNAYLAEENFPQATAAFQRARELDPKRAYVADRLAEVARQQHAASATLPATAHP